MGLLCYEVVHSRQPGRIEWGPVVVLVSMFHLYAGPRALLWCQSNKDILLGNTTIVEPLFPTLFKGYNEVGCNGALNNEFMDYYAELDLGWAASIDGILKVMYLSPDYLEYNRYTMGWVHSEQTTPTDIFDINVCHAKAILAAGQTQLDDKSASDPEQHAVSYITICYKSFQITKPNRFLSTF